MSPKALAEALIRPRRLKADTPQPAARLVQGGFDTALHLRGRPDAARRALLVHGWETDHRDLGAVADALAGRGYLCVLPDLPAHGASAGETMTIPEAAQALVQVGQAHGPFELCVGYSMGAAIALLAISRGMAVRRVAFLAPPANYVHQLSLSARAAGAPEPLVAAALESLRARCPELDAIDSQSMARHLTMPGLIVVAGRDEILDPADGRSLAAAWPGARLIELPEASHRSILRDAGALSAVTEIAA